MKSFALPVALAAVAVMFADRASAQSQIRYVAMAGGRPAAKSTQRPPARLTAQVAGEDRTATAVEEAAGAYAAGSVDSVAGLVGGAAYIGVGARKGGYLPDYGVLPGGMSVWPGVPACCDPWLGYCGEPRCNHCSCGRGRYLYFRCNKETCTPELVTWGGKCSKCQECGCSTCSECSACAEGSYSPAVAPRPVAEQSAQERFEAPPPPSSLTEEPAAKKSPPRNKLPKIPTPSALGKVDWFRK